MDQNITCTMRVQKLAFILKKNRKMHMDNYKKAMVAFKKKLQAKLEWMVKAVAAGKRISMNVHLLTPMKFDRKAWILSWLTRWPPTVNSLDEAFVDAYIGYTGATFEPKNWGAHWCKQLSNDLRKMFLAGVLVRKRISLGSNWQPGFPTWCWAYEKPPRYPVTEGRDQSRWMAFPPNYKQEPCCPTCNGPRDSDGSRIHEADCQIAKDEGLLRRD